MENKLIKIGAVRKVVLASLLFVMAGVSNASIIRAYDDPDGSGIVTYTDTGTGQLEIMFDNTSGADTSSLITGLVFDIVDDINAVTVDSFLSGNGDDLSSYYSVALDTNSSISPGNSTLDLTIQTTNGANAGIYNAAGNSGNLSATMFPDIAVLTLNISSPTGWTLSEISNDILRMQQTGTDGQGSLKVPGIPAVPVPAAVWLFGSGLLGLIGVARRKSHA